MYIKIEDQKAIAQIVTTFARKPKTHIKHIRISESREYYGAQIARLLYHDGRQKRHGEHLCFTEVFLLKDTAYLRFCNCKTNKTVDIKLEVTAD